MNYIGAREGVPVPTKPYERAGRAEWVVCECGHKGRPGGFHVCIDLDEPELVVALKPKKPAPKKKARKPRQSVAKNTCACGASIPTPGARQCRACWYLALKPECGTPEGYQWHYRQGKRDSSAQWPLLKADPCGCRAAWAKRRGPRYESLDPLAPQAVALYEAGKSTKQIAVELKVSAMGISRLLKRNGVTMRPPGSQPGRPRPTTRRLTPEQEAQVVDAYRAGGVTYASLAVRYGVSKSVIRWAMRRANDTTEGAA